MDDGGNEERRIVPEADTADKDENKTNSCVASDESNSKEVNDVEAEPRSKIGTDTAAAPADDVASRSVPELWDLPADFDVYCINQFESVTTGKEAGWPGQWEEVVEEEMIEEQLLYSLQMKGSAMSNESWQGHWTQVGPGLLASGWLEQYPSVPLAQVEQITGITFLSEAVQSSKLSDAVEKMSLNETENPAPSKDVEKKEEHLDPPDISGLSIDDNAIKGDDQGTLEVTSPGVDLCQDNQTQQGFSNEEIAEMWSNFYNDYYWYCYQRFVGVVGDGASNQSGVNLIEDYVAARKCYDPADRQVAAEQDDVVPKDDKTSLTAESKTTDQNSTTCCLDSEPTNESTSAKNELIDFSASQDVTQSCPNSQEECKKENPDSLECGGCTENPSSQGDSKTEPADSQEVCEGEGISNPERPNEEKEDQMPPADNDKKEGKKGDAKACESERTSNPEKPNEEKEQQIPPADNVKKEAKKANAKQLWQLSKSTQYTSIVWVLQEAGIIPSNETSSEVVNNQTPCHDNIHCNGTDPDKETEDEDTTSKAPEVSENTSSGMITPVSPALNDSHDESTKASLKRKR